MPQPYIRRTPEQWQQIIHQQTDSGLSQERFCKENGIAYGTFQTWRKKLSGSAHTEQAFIEIPRSTTVRHDEHTLPLDQGLRVRLELGRGVVLELSGH